MRRQIGTKSNLEDYRFRHRIFQDNQKYQVSTRALAKSVLANIFNIFLNLITHDTRNNVDNAL